MPSVLNFHFNCPFSCAKEVFLWSISDNSFLVISIALPALTKLVEPIGIREVSFLLSSVIFSGNRSFKMTYNVMRLGEGGDFSPLLGQILRWCI